MTEPSPDAPAPEADPQLMEALRRLAQAPTLLAAFDFDGTLAPFTVDPQDSRALPESQEALDRLAGMERTHVGIISGRDLGFLQSVVDHQRTKLLSGSHGAELDLRPLGPDAGDSAIRLSPEQLVLLDRAVDAVREVVERHPGAKAELKPAGVCLHTRPMEDQSRSDAALTEMRERFEDLGGLRITPGQQVMECSVLSATKGEGVEALIRATGADAALFAGDDVTDEDGMRALRTQDVGLKVGDKETIAPFRVESPQALGRLLTVFARLRAEALG
ncbi:trehalose-phosphatase [Kocuria palustris]|uniref:trehalose-phosphatase n=1 Tax=Kocuria palustris TaxID=71999 RepID=UPI00119DD674|nr:trehalose-phosphatase [Kocuria palustris]